MGQALYEFGNKSVYDFAIMTPGQQPYHLQYGQAPRLPFNDAGYDQAIDDINTTFGIRTDTDSGQQFELAWANKDASAESVDLEISTYSSSLSGNDGNAVELAGAAAQNPNRTRVYVASMGNGGSSFWTPEEVKYIRKTGRFTTEDGEPLPTMEALARVLRAADLVISRITTNSAGGSYAAGLMSALPEGQVTHGYFKSRPNITNHGAWGLGFGKAMVTDDKKTGQQYAAASHDSRILTQEMKDGLRARAPRIYDFQNPDAGKWSYGGKASELLYGNTAARMGTLMVALSRGGRQYGYPATQDTLAALRRQPSARLTYHFPDHDPSYGETLQVDVREFMKGLLPYDVQVEALIMPGTHNDHKYYPALRWSIEKYAFEK